MPLRFLLVVLFALSAGAASARDEPYRVLLLQSFRSALPINAQIASAITKGLNAKADLRVEIDAESLDLSRLDEERYAELLIEVYRAKYRAAAPDLIITTNNPALQFLLKFGQRIFPEVPIVFCSADKSFIDATQLPPNVTGVAKWPDVAGTLELMSQLHPDMQHVVLIIGSSKLDQQWEQVALQALHPYESRFDWVWLRGIPLVELVERVKNLPPHSVILYLIQLADRNGIPNVPKQTVQAVAETANAPVYANWDTLIGTGIVGGRLIDEERDGELAGQIARRILMGEAPATIPIVEHADNEVMVDARQLEKWGVRESRLPPGSRVLYRQPSIWVDHRDAIIAGVTVIAIQALLIAALLANRRKLRRARISLEDEYDHRVQAENTSRRLRARVAATEKQSNLGVLAADIAHEISQPLISIKNYAQAAKRYIRGEGPHENKLRELLVEMEDEAGRAGAIIQKTRKLLGSGRVDAVPAELGPILNEVLLAMGAELEGHHCRVEYENAAPVPLVFADSLQIQLVMVNLLRNAVEAMESSEPHPDLFIAIRTCVTAEHTVEVTVADRGPGVLPESVESIFDSLYTTKATGMGVGLATCRTIIEAHGGRIWYSPNPPGGAIFHFTLSVA